MKKFLVRISYLYYDRLALWAKENGMSVSAAIRYIVIMFFKDKPYK